MQQISAESAELCRRYYKQKHSGLFFLDIVYKLQKCVWHSCADSKNFWWQFNASVIHNSYDVSWKYFTTRECGVIMHSVCMYVCNALLRQFDRSQLSWIRCVTVTVTEALVLHPLLGDRSLSLNTFQWQRKTHLYGQSRWFGGLA